MRDSVKEFNKIFVGENIDKAILKLKRIEPNYFFRVL